MNPDLSPHDLARLSGYIRPSAQMRWLRDNRIGFTLNALGRPVTTWTLVEQGLRGDINGKQDDAYRSAAPTR